MAAPATVLSYTLRAKICSMRTIKFAVYSILFTAPTITGPGCKKNNDKKANCQLISASSPTAGNGYIFLYDNEDKLIRTSLGGSVATYDYSDNTTVITNLDSGKFTNKSTVTKNADGLAINVRTEYDQTGTVWNNTSYEYTGTELSKSTFTSSAGGNAMITTYTWLNQNLVASKQDTTVSTLGYYTDRPRQTGDFLSLIQFIQGYEIYRTKNLLKTLSGSNLIYIFGTDGKINSIEVVSGASTTFLDYQYQCN
jgi:hypothetical protein